MTTQPKPQRRKELIRAYKETARPAGLFVVRNVKSGRMLVGKSTDLPGMLNRQQLQLEMGSHPDKELQADWSSLGPDTFTIEVLDTLDIPEEGTADLPEELAELKEMWLERLDAAGSDLYPMSRR